MNRAKLLYIKLAIYQLRSLKSFLEGFGAYFYLSEIPGPLANTDHKSSEITLACLFILAAIINEKSILSF